MRAIILAAGLGSRLGLDLPKPLTQLPDGRSILRQQLDNLDSALGLTGADITMVVGHRAAEVVEAAPDVRAVYNGAYDRTNTAKSLLHGLRSIPAKHDVLWLNGDVVFDALILGRAVKYTHEGVSFVAVNTAVVGEEEVKYTLDASGYIDELAKTSTSASTEWLGEAIGINYLAARDRPAFQYRLAQVGDQDYFERALELGIRNDALRLRPLDTAGLRAIEIDTIDDLAAARRVFAEPTARAFHA